MLLDRIVKVPCRTFLSAMNCAPRAHSPPTPPSAEAAAASAATETPCKRPRLDDHSQQRDLDTAPIASTSKLPYDQGLHLAPMVRIGTLPVRLLSLEYGAELVWGPEIIDKAIIGCDRTVDPLSGVIRFTKQGKPIWETHPTEKPRVIFQMGSADPKLAVQAARVVERDVAGIGLNCGCPKAFSIQGGMGAALLSEPDKLCSILSALSKEITVPIDAKIRLSPDPETTFTLVRRLVSETGIANLTVHCRTRDMRSSEKAMHERLADIVAIGKAAGVPVVANGDCCGVGDQEWIRDMTGVTSIMIARGAEANPSCFSPSGWRDPVDEVMPKLLRIAIASDNPFGNTKYILNSMHLTAPSTNHVTAASSTVPSSIKSRSKDIRSAIKVRMNQAKTYATMCEAVGMCPVGEGPALVARLQQPEFRTGWVEECVPEWTKRREQIVREAAGREVNEDKV